jgi:predicted O-methyltransferase YrrM
MRFPDLILPFVQVIAENVKNAGLSSKVKVIVGPAHESMLAMQPEAQAPFDFVFIDADKESATKYFIEAKRLLRKGGVIVWSFIQQQDIETDMDCRSSTMLARGGP